ncbi:hypothetical protein MA16_Dca018854 [Dendrobium catenatum]|uniref:Uncharacterized protein n=1 Tax=Dendrobium catenatum TaxID=906689 RepID=A0A2I0WS51_9ASPA|nr:hypothetical protein MA16_Dca018854 [Dendrobium catenatum]
MSDYLMADELGMTIVTLRMMRDKLGSMDLNGRCDDELGTMDLNDGTWDHDRRMSLGLRRIFE